MPTKLNARQIVSRDVLDQIAVAAGAELDNILRSINSNETAPLSLSAVGTNRIVNIGSIFVTNPETSKNKTIPTINNALPNFTSGTVTAPSTGAGSITVSAGSPLTIAMTANQFLKIGININNVGNISLSAGTAGSSLAAATAPAPISNTFSPGYIVLRTDSSSNMANILNSDIYQYVGGGGGGSGSGSSNASAVSQTAHGFVVGNLLYHNGTSYVKAIATSATTSSVVGMVSGVTDVDNFTLTTSGLVTGLSGLTIGADYFLDATTAGAMAAIEPMILGQVSVPVGIAANTTSIYIAIKRGIVVGGVNARTFINLANNAITTIQNAAAYDSGELTGWVTIAATTPLRFFVRAPFAKNGAGSDYNISPSYVGDTVPVGFSTTITSAGLIRMTLPSIAGYTAASVDFALNAPAVGATFPLNIDSSNVSFGTVRAKDVNGISIRNAGDTTTNVFVSDAGNVGVGISSPSSYGHGGTNKFIQVQNSDTSVNAQAHCIINSSYNSAGVSSIGTLSWALPNVTPANKLSAYIGAATEGGHTLAIPNVALSFATRNTTLGPTERMRIDASGNALHNTTTAPSILSSTPVLTLKHSGTVAIWGVGPTSSFGNFYISTGTGGVFLAEGGTAWQAVSDERMKKNIEPLELGLEQIKALKPTRFDYIDEESENSSRVGFIAQEVLSVLPHAVHVPEDAEQMMGVSATEMIPVLVKAIQEQQSIIEKLEARLAALENK